jgi:imidazolonepropionase
LSAGSVSFEGATQILRPPEDGLLYLRGGELERQTLDPGQLTVRDGVIVAHESDPGAKLSVDASGCALIPGFVDCHTHLPFAGWREREYSQKVRGVSYQEISRSGGGIASSASALAEAADETVLELARALSAEMLAAGTTAFECKSGYGLSRERELRALRLAKDLGPLVAQRTTSTALLAHSVPEGYTADRWIEVVAQMLPEVIALGSVSALDIFVETVAFSNRHLERMGELAAGAGLALRAHVEQFASHRSVPVALAAGARSVDHLSMLHADDIAPLAESDCSAVLLPAAEFLGAEHRAPARALLQAGAIVVLASDFNPGTAPVLSMPLVIGLATRLYGLSAREALGAATLNAARTLGLESDTGSIEVGKRADLLVLDGPAERVAYRLGHNPVALAFVGGEPVYVRDAQASARLGGR